MKPYTVVIHYADGRWFEYRCTEEHNLQDAVNEAIRLHPSWFELVLTIKREQ